jgi:hypothetical protein
VKTIPTSLPRRLINAYWQEVKTLLVQTHQVSTEAARNGIRRYRRMLARGGVGDMVYHADAKDTAAGIMTGGYTD